MWHSGFWIVLSLLLLSQTTFFSASRDAEKNYAGRMKSSVFLSPPFSLREGSVANKFYYDIPFPRGHIALKSFNAEVVDEMGIPVSIHDTYVHHWLVGPYHTDTTGSSGFKPVINAGVCKNILFQYFGSGSETRKTSTWVPEPYGIEVGNPAEIPRGYEERWLMNVHAIDTRAVKDRLGCAECKCSLYNATEDEYGHSLEKDYIGGLHCCYDQSQCQLREGFKDGQTKKLNLRYTVKWVDWDETILPAMIYIFDVTADSETNDCKVEYQVEPCDQEGEGNRKCVDTMKTRVVFPRGGDLIYGVGHQHAGGLGVALYGQDGRTLCSSLPYYGDGEEVGNEAGYIVGMSTCYPKPGTVQIFNGELLTVESNYNSTRLHVGVMGLVGILVADPQPKTNSVTHFLSISHLSAEIVNCNGWAFSLVGGMLLAIGIGIGYIRRSDREGYHSI